MADFLCTVAETLRNGLRQECGFDPGEEIARRLARMVLTAGREPSDAMVEAVLDRHEVKWFLRNFAAREARQDFTTAIDAALSAAAQ